MWLISSYKCKCRQSDANDNLLSKCDGVGVSVIYHILLFQVWGTVRPSDHFNAQMDCTALKKAMDGAGMKYPTLRHFFWRILLIPTIQIEL